MDSIGRFIGNQHKNIAYILFSNLDFPKWPIFFQRRQITVDEMTDLASLEESSVDMWDFVCEANKVTSLIMDDRNVAIICNNDGIFESNFDAK